MKILLAALVLISALTINSFSQTQAEYAIEAVKGEYLLIGQKSYKMVDGACPGFDVGVNVSFSENPITCEKATLINLLELSKCEVECLDNEDPPAEY